MQKQSDKKSIFFVFLVFLFIYVLLFEFILPVNKILPRPTLLFDSYISLWSDYNLLFASGITTTIIYASILLGYIAVSLVSQVLIKLFIETPGLFNAPRIFRYFPPFFFALLFIYWFKDSFTAELVFGFLYSFCFLGLSLYHQIEKTKPEYIDYARGLGIGKNKIYSSIIWKSSQPAVFNEIKYLHYSLWVIILVYEFIGSEGIGKIYNLALSYNDLAAIFALGILVSALIMIGNYLITYLKNKIIYWES